MEPFRIIYVEDSEADADLFRTALFQMRPSSELTHIRTGSAAQTLLAENVQEEHRIEIIVIDINLPGMSGRELITWIRSQDSFSSVPVIAVSGSLAFRTVEAAEEIGATSFILKPRNYNGWVDLLYQIQDYCAV